MTQQGRLIQMATYLQKEIEGAFSEIIHTRWGASESVWVPMVDIFEGQQEYVVVADLPGVDPSRIDIMVKETSIRLSGQRMLMVSKGKAKRVIAERSTGHFVRTICLPGAVDTEMIRHKCENGVLEVELRKKL